MTSSSVSMSAPINFIYPVHLNPKVTSLFMMPDEKYIHINSTVVKDVAKNKGDISSFVPDCVNKALMLKYSR